MIDKYSDMFSPAGAEVSIIPVMSGEIPSQTEDIAMPDTLPLLALRNAVIFPGSIFPITIGRDKSIKLIEDAHKSNSLIGAVPQNDVSVEEPALDDLFPFGTVARIIKTFESLTVRYRLCCRDLKDSKSRMSYLLSRICVLT